MIDHLVLAAPDLAGLVAWFRGATAVVPTPGGAHLGRGTRNELVALGGTTYLELIGPDPEQPTPAGPRPFGIDALDRARLVTWCLRPAVLLEDAVERMRAHGWDPGEIASMRRRRPDGVLLDWRLTLRPMSADVAAVPFLIDWLDSPHPTATLPAGAALSSLTASHPDPGRLRSLLDDLGETEVDVVDGPPSLTAELSTPLGSLTLH